MWANAQHGGRTAEYIGGAPVQRRKVSLTPTTRVLCSNAAKTRNPLKLAGVPKLTNGSQPLVSRSSPYCKNMLGKILLFNNYFSNCRRVP